MDRVIVQAERSAWMTSAISSNCPVSRVAAIPFAGLDMGVETRLFYRAFYGLELTDDELARVLQGLPPADT